MAIDAGNQAWIDGMKEGNVGLITATYVRLLYSPNRFAFDAPSTNPKALFPRERCFQMERLFGGFACTRQIRLKNTGCAHRSPERKEDRFKLTSG
jgi:hypothetical protein